jgi:CHASE3 domain sensor protein
VTGCQKEVLYLKALVQTLKRELQEADQKRQHQQQVDKKQKLVNLIWMLVVGLFLIAIVIMLAQVSQKVGQLLSQPILIS